MLLAGLVAFALFLLYLAAALLSWHLDRKEQS